MGLSKWKFIVLCILNRLKNDFECIVATQDVIDKVLLNSTNLINWYSDNQMEANPSEFQVLLSNEAEPTNIIINDIPIQSEPNVKLLGVQIDNRLNFSKHISIIINRASRQVICLKRLACSLDTKSKLLLYKAFVLSNFNYCPAVWHMCSSVNSNKLEKVQYRALKFVFNN